MKKLYTVTVVFVLVLLIVVVLAGAALFGFYQLYLKPQPADFEFSQTVDDSTIVEIIQVKKVSDTELSLIPLQEIKNTDEFFEDFNSLECTSGVSIEALSTFANLDSLDAIKITYADGNFDVITPYGNIDSTVFTPDITLETLMNEKYFFFDPTEFGALIDKYTE